MILKKILVLPIFAVLITILSFLPHDASASTPFSQATCNQMQGIWTSNTCTISGHSRISLGTTLLVYNGQTLKINSGSTLAVTGHLQIDSGGILANTGLIIIYNGYIMNHGTISNSGTVTNYGTISNSGTVTNSGMIYNNGPFARFSLGTGIINNIGTVTNSGTISGTGKFYSSLTSITNTGSITNSVTIPNTRAPYYYTLNIPITIPLGVTLDIPAPSACGSHVPNKYIKFFLPCGFIVNPHVSINNYGTLLGGSIRIDSDASINNNNGGYIIANDSITNYGNIKNDGIFNSLINNWGVLDNDQTGIIYGGGLTNTNGSAPVGATNPSGIILMNPGIITNYGNIAQFGDSSNKATIYNFGVINVGCSVKERPSSYSDIQNTASSCMVPPNPNSFVRVPGSLTNGGDIYNNNGGIINTNVFVSQIVNNAIILNSGTINNNGYANNGDIISNNAIIINSGTINEYCGSQLNGNLPTGSGTINHPCT